MKRDTKYYIMQSKKMAEQLKKEREKEIKEKSCFTIAEYIRREILCKEYWYNRAGVFLDYYNLLEEFNCAIYRDGLVLSDYPCTENLLREDLIVFKVKTNALKKIPLKDIRNCFLNTCEYTYSVNVENENDFLVVKYTPDNKKDGAMWYWAGTSVSKYTPYWKYCCDVCRSFIYALTVLTHFLLEDEKNSTLWRVASWLEEEYKNGKIVNIFLKRTIMKKMDWSLTASDDDCGWVSQQIKYSKAALLLLQSSFSNFKKIHCDFKNISNLYLRFCSYYKSGLYDEKEIKPIFDFFNRFESVPSFNREDVKKIENFMRCFSAKENTSIPKGERRICEVLSLLDIPFETQMRFDNCKNKKALPFDVAFRVNNELVLCEHQGIQHFQTVQFFDKNKTESLDYRKNNDNIKYEYCKNNSIKLFYSTYENIDDIYINLLSFLTRSFA